MNAAQVRAKARLAMKRREEDIETEEREGGELNLVPYLDIIPNVVLFLLASVTTGLVLGTVNSSLPEFSAGAAAAVSNAVNDALSPFGAIITEIPLTPQLILTALGRISSVRYSAALAISLACRLVTTTLIASSTRLLRRSMEEGVR